jgi:hypothetical protein
LTDIITVLESQRRSFNAQRSLLQVSNQRLQNRIDLYLALGGDFGAPVDGEREVPDDLQDSGLSSTPDGRGGKATDPENR